MFFYKKKRRCIHFGSLLWMQQKKIQEKVDKAYENAIQNERSNDDGLPPSNAYSSYSARNNEDYMAKKNDDFYNDINSMYSKKSSIYNGGGNANDGGKWGKNINTGGGQLGGIGISQFVKDDLQEKAKHISNEAINKLSGIWGDMWKKDDNENETTKEEERVRGENTMSFQQTKKKEEKVKDDDFNETYHYTKNAAYKNINSFSEKKAAHNIPSLDDINIYKDGYRKDDMHMKTNECKNFSFSSSISTFVSASPSSSACSLPPPPPPPLPASHAAFVSPPLSSLSSISSMSSWSVSNSSQELLTKNKMMENEVNAKKTYNNDDNMKIIHYSNNHFDKNYMKKTDQDEDSIINEKTGRNNIIMNTSFNNSNLNDNTNLNSRYNNVLFLDEKNNMMMKTRYEQSDEIKNEEKKIKENMMEKLEINDGIWDEVDLSEQIYENDWQNEKRKEIQEAEERKCGKKKRTKYT